MKKGRVWRFITLALSLFALDAAVKFWAQSTLQNAEISPPFYPYGGVGVFRNFLGIDFSLTYVRNNGGAWGVLSSFPKALVFIRIGIILTLALYTFFLNKISKRTLPYTLILVGAAANIVDYFVYGAVVDMFHFILWGYSYPVFNVADMLIFFGVAILLIQTLIDKKKRNDSYATQPSKN